MARRRPLLEDLEAKLRAGNADDRSLIDSPSHNPICSLSVDPTVPCINVLFGPYATTDQYRYLMEKLIAMISEHKIGNVLSDASLQLIIQETDIEWTIENWVPRAIKAGLRRMASMRRKTPFGERAAHAIHAEMRASIDIRYFDAIDSAREWLRSSL